MKVTYTIIHADPNLEERFGPVEIPYTVEHDEDLDLVAVKCVEDYAASTGDGPGDGESCEVVVFDERGLRELGRFTVYASVSVTYEATPIAEEGEDRDAD